MINNVDKSLARLKEGKGAELGLFVLVCVCVLCVIGPAVTSCVMVD